MGGRRKINCAEFEKRRSDYAAHVLRDCATKSETVMDEFLSRDLEVTRKIKQKRLKVVKEESHRNGC